MDLIIPLLTETDWTHIENILGGAALLIVGLFVAAKWF